MAPQLLGSEGESLPSYLRARTARAINLLLGRDDDKCHPSPNINLCEKPAVSSQAVTGIIVGVVVGVILVSTLSIMLWFHLKKKRRDKAEEVDDQFQMSDYGLDDGPVPASRPKPQGQQRLSLDDLRGPGVGANGRNPFADDNMSVRSAGGFIDPNAHHALPKRFDSNESSQSSNLPLPK